jgi:hypothetical protein
MPIPVPALFSTTDGTPDAVETVNVHADKRKTDETSTTVSAAEARDVPGAEGDAVRVLQTMPGVARPSFGGTGQLVVWGAAPEDTRVYVDGVEVPSLYHLGGLRSILPSELVRDVTLVPGAYGADYGRALGGIARVETRALQTEGTHGFVSADTLDGGAMVTTALSDRVRVGVAARYGWIDKVAAAVTKNDVDPYVPIPQYGDWQAVTQIALRKSESVKVVLLGSDDALTTRIPSADPQGARSQALARSFQRLYAVYAHGLEDGSVVRVTPFVGRDSSRRDDDFGPQPDHLDQSAFVYGVRASNRMPLASFLAVTAGVDALGRAARVNRAGSLTDPPREGDVVAFGQPPGSDFAVDSWSVHELDVAPYVVGEIRLGKVVVTPGVRFDAFFVEGSRQTPRVGQTPAIGYARLDAVIDPRVSVRWTPAPAVTCSASAGVYHQPPAPEDMSAVFGTPALTYAGAEHASVGQTLHVTSTLDVEAVGFYEAMNDLVVRSRLDTPKLALALVQNGEGRSYGAQFVARQRLRKGLFGWLTWTMSRSERRYVGDPGWRLLDYDQTHVVSAVVSQAIGSWTLGARIRYATGLPRTPVVGAIFDSKDDVDQPVFGAQNSMRLPSFWDLDLRVERAFALSRAVTLRAYLEVLNATNQSNDEEVVYDASWSRRGFIHGLPTVAVVGAKAEF